MNEGSLILKTTDVCTWCTQEYGEDPLILVESGRVLPMRKDPNVMRFYADWLLPSNEQPLSVVTFVFHFKCFYETMTGLGMEWYTRGSDRKCYSCDHSFKNDKWGFRYTVGGIGTRNEFEPDLEIPVRPLMCTGCTTAVFGQGDELVGDQILHAELDDHTAYLKR